MNLQDKAVSYVLDNPGCTMGKITLDTGCKSSVAYAAMSAVSKIQEIKSTERVIGIIADTHEPACHPDYFDFIKKTFKRFNVTEIVHIGDVVDHHFISRHVSETDAFNPLDEMDLAIKNLKKWVKEFPDVKICLGNHDRIPDRQVKTLGIPSKFLRNLNDIYELPKTWEFKNHFEINDIWFEHGIGSSGMYGAKNTALKYRMSYVQGHTHANAGIFHMTSPKDSIFAMNVGAGVDESHLQMRYGKIFKNKSTLGCGIILGDIPIFVPMSPK